MNVIGIITMKTKGEADIIDLLKASLASLARDEDYSDDGKPAPKPYPERALPSAAQVAVPTAKRQKRRKTEADNKTQAITVPLPRI